ncbi:MAG: hypothetical protein ACFFDP_00315 [Promethearchaeota archaeon]
MAEPPKGSKPQSAPPLPLQEELKKIIQYIAQVYKLQKEFNEKLVEVDKRISGLESKLKTIVDKSIIPIQSGITTAVEKSIAPIQSNIKTTVEKSIAPIQSNIIAAVEKSIAPIQSNIKTTVEKSIAPMQSELLEAIGKLIQTVIADEVLPQLVGAALEPAPKPYSKPAPEPTREPAPAPEEPKPTLMPETRVEFQTPPSPPARRPSEIPDARVSTVVEELDNIVKELKGRQKVQREALRSMLEQARDIAMNNLASRAVAARTFKELINTVKNTSFDVPADVIQSIITKIEELSLHIQS